MNDNVWTERGSKVVNKPTLGGATNGGRDIILIALLIDNIITDFWKSMQNIIVFGGCVLYLQSVKFPPKAGLILLW